MASQASLVRHKTQIKRAENEKIRETAKRYREVCTALSYNVEPGPSLVISPKTTTKTTKTIENDDDHGDQPNVPLPCATTHPSPLVVCAVFFCSGRTHTGALADGRGACRGVDRVQAALLCGGLLRGCRCTFMHVLPVDSFHYLDYLSKGTAPSYRRRVPEGKGRRKRGKGRSCEKAAWQLPRSTIHRTAQTGKSRQKTRLPCAAMRGGIVALSFF